MQTSDVICFFIFFFLWANEPVVKNKVGGPKYVHRVQRKSNFIRHRLKPKDGGEEISDGTAFLLVGNVQERKKTQLEFGKKSSTSNLKRHYCNCAQLWKKCPPPLIEMDFFDFFLQYRSADGLFSCGDGRKKRRGGHKGKNKEMWAGWSSDRAKAERLVSGKELVRKELISCVCTRMETS